MSNQEKTLRSMTDRINAFCRGSFGITYLGGSRSSVLCSERCIYPISYMRISIRDQDGKNLFHGTELPQEYRLLLDDHGDAPAHARLALTRGANDVIAASEEMFPIQGSVLVVATTDILEPVTVAVSALFDIEEGRQVSSILWDASSELITHWVLQDKLFEKGGSSNEREQYHPEANSLQYHQPENLF